MRALLVFAAAAGVLGLFWLLFAREGVNFGVQQLMWQGGDPEKAGQWGDSFGAFNAFFGALGFAAILATLWTQSRALEEQRSDLHRQRFENTFFQLLRMIREGREQARFRPSQIYSIEHPTSGSRETVSGHAAFQAAFQEMEFWTKRRQESGEVDRAAFALIYAKRVHAPYESTFGAYYRLVYAALDRLRTDPYLSTREKDDLGNLVRGQMTSFEAALAGCNGLNDFSKDFSDLIVRFRLLKYARRGPVYDELRKSYPAEAFIGRDEVEEPDAEHDEDVGESR